MTAREAVLRGLCAAALALLVAGRAPAQDPDPERADPATAGLPLPARLARDLELYDSEIEAIAAFGHLGEFLEQVDPGGAVRAEPNAWRRGRIGWLREKALERFYDWNTPRETGGVLRAVEIDHPDHPFRGVVDLSRQLKAHGIDFLFVPVPSRLQIYPEELLELPSAEGFRGMVPGLTRFLRELAGAGVETVNLAPRLVRQRHGEEPSGEVYLRCNQHWTSRGAEIAARAVADRLAEMSWFRSGPLEEGRDFRVLRDRLRLRPERDRFPEGVDHEDLQRIAVVASDGTDLSLEDRASSILVIGDSYVSFLNKHSGGFLHHLLRFTGRRPDFISTPGSGARSPRLALQRRRDNLEGKRVVVWVISVVLIRIHSNWQPIPVFEH